MTNLGRVPLPVSTLIETRMSAREVLALQVGEIVALGHAATAPVAVHVGGVHRFAGRLACEPSGHTAVTIEHVSGGGLVPTGVVQ
jgi:flagellar motor switch protein FliM